MLIYDCRHDDPCFEMPTLRPFVATPEPLEDSEAMPEVPFSLLEPGASKMTHREAGTHRTVEYTAWVTMKDRCLDPTSKSFPYYGGRGITICLEWLQNYSAFLSYVGRRPSSDHQIDRINNNGNYEPGNVRWATRKEQCRNRRSSHVVTAFGTTATIAEWAEKTGKKAKLISQRIGLGWEPERALTAKSRRNDGYHLLEAGKEFEERA